LPTSLISNCRNYCLFPTNNGAKDGEATKKEIGPVFDSTAPWIDEDFREILPVTSNILKQGIYSEVPIAQFMVGGLAGKTFIN